MANAKKCDICGGFFEVPNVCHELHMSYEWNNTSMVRILRRKNDDTRIDHDVMQFDACEECLQDVLDYILSKKADTIEEGKNLYLD